MAHEDTRTPESEIAHAREELDEGHVENALRHLAVALSFDPSLVDALELVDRALAAGGERSLEPSGDAEGTFFGVAALRAYARARQGRVLDALEILLEVASFRPDVPYLGWALRWFGDAAPAEKSRDVTADGIGAGIVSFLESLPAGPDDEQDDGGTRENLESIVFLLGKLMGKYPGAERLAFAGVLTLRRLGRHDEAVALAKEWFADKGSWTSAVSVANAYRATGNIDDAIAWYRRALQVRPEDVSPLLDIGDLLIEDDRFEEAAAAYAEALRKRPGDAWAEPSHAFASYRATKEARWRTRLAELAARSPPDSRARELLGAVGAPRRERDD